jgi:hypothetical protein
MDVKRPLPASIRWLNELTYFFLSRAVMPFIFRHERAVATERPAAVG